MWHPNEKQCGYTLIEISVVLVIIGLIIGGVLAGQDLIHASRVRSLISQIETYNAAANTFREKYGNLPGDIPNATTFGFAPRGAYAGEGDGNGLIEGVYTNAANANGGFAQGVGETTMFWVDLSAAKLIENTFSTASSTANHTPSVVTATSSPSLAAYFPEAKSGDGNYVYIFTTPSNLISNPIGTYFGVAAIKSLGIVTESQMRSIPGMPVSDAYAVDNKIDDGLPLSGIVNVMYIYANTLDWSVGGGGHGGWGTPATPASATSCYDNNNVGGVKLTYSIRAASNGGTNKNCALSFKTQF